ncbi:hypothetical protein B0J18DRAFT_300952 [Chaetomium sp. MPI-SDFR-AT-0129]|nr:hypothetical protein B0J18DRAFT_300952 [Chaetomium sp. MPI-SDFR-AT-0129]
MAETPKYYPAGWDRERMLNSAATGEINNLSEAERDTFREGLRQDLGDAGFEQFFEEMWKREKAAKGIHPTPTEPSFMETMRLREERIGPAARWDPWGFVVFKSPEIQDHEEWEKCKDMVEKIVRDSTEIYRGYEGLDECLERMKLRWVEDVEVGAGVEDIARLYGKMDLPPGLKHTMCLYVTPSSMRSILDSPTPSTANRRYRVDIPWVVAVSVQAARVQESQEEGLTADEDEVEGAEWRGFFNAAVETLLEGLFPIVANDSLSPYEIGGHASGEDIWCDHTRYGVHQAGVGYWDRRSG